MLEVFEEAQVAERSRGVPAYVRFCIREAGGLLANLLIQERVMKHKRLMMHGGLAGVLIGGAFAFAYNSRPYTSKAVLRVLPSMISERLLPGQSDAMIEISLPAIAQTVTSRSSLVAIITRFNLYRDERSRVPMEDVIELMRRDIRFESTKESQINLSFSYPDRFRAQKVTAELVSRYMTENTRERATRSVLNVHFLKDGADTARLAWESSLEALRAARASGASLERLQLDAEIARERYKTLSEKVAQAQIVESLERRVLGQSLEVLDPASLPSESRMSVALVTALGALIGAICGWLVSMFLMRSPRQPIPEAA